MAVREIYLEIGKVNQREQSLKVALTKRIFKLGRDPQWSDFWVLWPELAPRHAFFLREGNDYRIYGGGDRDPERYALAIRGQPIDSDSGYLLSHGDLIRVGHRPTVYLRYYNVTTSSAPSPDVGGNVNIDRSLPPEPAGSPVSCVQLENRDLFTIGCEAEADLQLVASTVMESHAMLVKKRHRYWLQNSNARSTFVNEKFVKRNVPLKQGDVIRIGPYFLLFSPKRLDVITSGNQVQIGARQMSVALGRFLNRKQILNEITLTCRTGELVALVGGSGAGKSTLMKALLGIAPVTSGELLINGHPLKQHFNLYRTSIGYVPQDDIIHTDLTVNEVLTYACRLRLPPRSPIREIVDRALQQVDMSSVRNSLASKLSGGQRKRVSIAVELLSDPQILFLDEPTSGLDPGLDRQLMELLKDIAKQGRLVVLVTHATENIGVCDRIAFLGSGGRLCYFGPSAGAVNFFKRHNSSVHSFTDIYDLFNQKNKVERAAQYWQANNKHAEESVRHQDAMPKKAIRPNRPQASRLRQLVTLSRRYLTLTLRDYRSAAISLITAPIAIALIKLPLPDEEPLASITGSVTQAPLALKTLFVITCAALWVGLSSSIQEIVKESSIYRRERLINLGLFTYVGSKLLVRTLLALGQTGLIVWIVLRLFEAPSPEVISWPLGLGISTLLTLISASSLGLLMSAIADSEAAANSFLPLVLLPQIIFSGVLFDLQGVASKVSWLTISRWSMGAYGALVDVNAMVPESKTVPGITLPPPPFEVSSVYAPDISNLSLNWLILLVQTVFYAILTAVIQRSKDDI